MTHSRLGRLAPAAAASTPAAALANTGVGVMTVASIVMVFALVPVVLVEALVLGWRLRLRPGRALWVSLVANFVSTFAGLLIGLVLDLGLALGLGFMGGAGWPAALIGLVVFFGITLAIERPVVRHMQPQAEPSAVGRAVLLANAITYAGMAVAAVILTPADPMAARMRITEAFNAAGVAKIEQAEHFAQHGAFDPLTRENPSRYARRIVVDDKGRVTTELAIKDFSDLDGKTFVLAPELREGKVVAWYCYVPEAPLKHFPAHCRFRSAEEARRWMDTPASPAK